MKHSRAFVLLALMALLLGAVPLYAQDATPEATPDMSPKVQIVSETDTTITVRHELGETTIPKHPLRIVAVTGTVELEALLVLDVRPIAAAGDDDEIGGTVWGDQLKPLMDGIEMLPSRRNTNFEKVLEAKPDLIIGSTGWITDSYDQLNAIAPTVALDYNRPWQAVTRDVALLVGQSERGERYLADYDARIDSLVQRYGPAVKGMTYSQIKSFLSEGEIQVYGNESNAGAVLARLGMFEPDEQLKVANETGSISPERIDLLDTDVVFVFHYPGPAEQTEIDSLEANPLFANLKAVKAGRVMPVISSWWYLSGAVSAEHLLDDLEQTILPALTGITPAETPNAEATAAA